MAIIRVSPKLLQTFPHVVRSFSHQVTTPLLDLQKPIPSPLSLDDGDSLFSSMSTPELFRSLLNLQMASFGPIVDMGTMVMKSRMMKNKVLNKAILASVKHTFYEHFCAGENLDEASQTLQRLWDSGLRGILDYGLEDATDNASCDRNLDEFMKTVYSTTMLPPSSVSYACVKISAICPISLLKRVSDLLRWEHKDPTFHLPWKRDDMFPILCDSSPFYHTLQRPDPLTPEEETDLQQAQQRLFKLSQKCLQMNLPLLVDAEYTWMQPAIDYLTYSAMIEFNKNKNPIVFGTVQAYLKDAKERTTQATQAAEKMGITIGLKLVRGAYMSSESQIASSLGFSSPIHGSIQDTHACYNDCASVLINKVSTDSAAVLLATHNLESGKLAVSEAQGLGIGKGNQKLQFAQLKGMAEGLSFGLRNAGFMVSKYLAYGPVEMVIPFLLRRAEENRSLLSASTVDRQLMRMELTRRLRVAFRGKDLTRELRSSATGHRLPNTTPGRVRDPPIF